MWRGKARSPSLPSRRGRRDSEGDYSDSEGEKGHERRDASFAPTSLAAALAQPSTSTLYSTVSINESAEDSRLQLLALAGRRDKRRSYKSSYSWVTRCKKYRTVFLVVIVVVVLVACSLAKYQLGLYIAGIAYVLFNELWRTRYYKDKVNTLTQRYRSVMERRRAAGLRRLEQETAASRRLTFVQPPASTAAALLNNKNQAISVNYRSLAVSSLTQTSSLINEFRKSGDFKKAREVEMWVAHELLQAGLRPDADGQLFQLLHSTLDSIEDGAPQLQSPQSKGLYCRLCLSQIYANNKGTRLRCKHELCKRCSFSLVDRALDGHVQVPIYCPVGCSCQLQPHLLVGLLDDEKYDRFNTLHQVRTSLQQSAPHSRNLGDALAKARASMPPFSLLT